MIPRLAILSLALFSTTNGGSDRVPSTGIVTGRAHVAAAPSKGHRLPTIPAKFTLGRTKDDQLAQKLTDAWNSHDANAVVAMFTADAVYEDVSFGLLVKGSEEIRAFAQGFFDMVPDLRIDLVSSSICDGHGYLEWIFSGTDVGIFKTGKTFRVRGSTVLDVHGDLISRNLDYYDLATLMRQLGVLPPGL